jgi:hypothetical protein
MSKGSGVSRGDRNRNARLIRLREAVPILNAIVGIDLADRKQMLVVCDTTRRCWRGARSGARPGSSGRRWTGRLTGRVGRGSLG